MDYLEMLKKARSELPDTVANVERFKIEKVRGHLEGNKTIISNFKKIAKDLHRSPDRMLKYLQKEMATPAKFVGERTVFGSKISASNINRKIRQYVHEFVICSECGKPDTVIEKKGQQSFIKCKACGAEHPVKSF